MKGTEKKPSLEERLNSLSLPDAIPKPLTQRDVVEQNKEYIRKRASGDLVSLDTDYERLNKAVGGFEPNTILTVTGLSGGGKSTLSKRISNSMTKNLIAKDIDCICLSFNFEMLAHKTVGREVANKGKFSLKELYSSEHPLAASRMEYIFNVYHKSILDYPIIYVEEPQNHRDIGNIIYYYWKNLCKATGAYMIVEIDHAVIIKGMDGSSNEAKTKIDSLMETLNACKKKIATEGGNVFYMVLSQMNRDIKDKDRIQSPSLHYPMSSDLYSSSRQVVLN